MMRLPRISLPVSIVILLAILLVSYLLETIGRFVAGLSFYSLFWLEAAAVSHAQIWRLVTHVLLPGGILQLLMSGIAIGWLGSRVARVWSVKEFFLYCGLCVGIAGAVRSGVSFGNAEIVFGPTPLVIALLVVWARMFGHERIRLLAWDVRGMTVGLFWGVAMVVLATIFAGWKEGLFLASAGGSGWLYLSARWKANRAQSARAVESRRMNRLEL